MILFISITIIVFSLIMFLYNRKLHNYNGFLAAYLTIFAIYAIAHYINLYSNNVYWIAIFWNNFSPLYLISGPLLYFYVKATLQDRITWKWTDALHLIPSTVLFIGLVPYLFSPFEEKLLAAQRIAADLNQMTDIRMNQLFSNVIVHVSRPVLILGYILASANLLSKKVKQEKEKSRQFLLVTRWISILLITSSALMLILATMGVNLFKKDMKTMLAEMKELHTLAGAILLLLPLTLLLFPQILYGIPVRTTALVPSPELPNPQAKKGIEPNTKNREAFQQLSQKIIDYFNQEKPYLDRDFSLTKLAAALQVPQHHVSYCFSEFIDTSFTKLRASKRVDYAKTLLLQGITKEFSLDKVAELSGFSSPSTFFSTFKEYTGLTPLEFKQQSG